VTPSEGRAAIREVILRYGAALDARDAEGVLSCFTDDVCLEYFNGQVVKNGIEAAGAFFRFDGAGGLPGLDRVVATTHLWSIGAIDVEGDRATCCTSCVAYLVGTAGGDGVLVTRGLRYVDELQRSPSGWRIRHRRHHPDWETRTPATIAPAGPIHDA
jgi:ketosteroid isomerase-like protein